MAIVFMKEALGISTISLFYRDDKEDIINQMQRINQEAKGTTQRYTKVRESTMTLYKEILHSLHIVGWTPLSVRGIYYRIVSNFSRPKTEETYKKVQKALKNMRLIGVLDPYYVVDGTRGVYGVGAYDSLESALNNSIEAFRRDMWQDLEYNIEILVEKNAMIDVLHPIYSKWGVKLVSTRGFNSLTSWFNMAKRFKRNGKKNVILLLTDYDTAGITMFKTAINVMSDYFDLIDDGRVEIRRISVTPAQIEEYGLITRPDKIKGETMQAVELDAFLPKDIQNILESAIMDYVTEADLNMNEELENEQKEQYRDLLGWNK